MTPEDRFYDTLTNVIIGTVRLRFWVAVVLVTAYFAFMAYILLGTLP